MLQTRRKYFQYTFHACVIKRRAFYFSEINFEKIYVWSTYYLWQMMKLWCLTWCTDVQIIYLLSIKQKIPNNWQHIWALCQTRPLFLSNIRCSIECSNFSNIPDIFKWQLVIAINYRHFFNFSRKILSSGRPTQLTCTVWKKTKMVSTLYVRLSI